jgi:CRISPR-associated protein Cmr2
MRDDAYWKTKVAAWIHDPAEKALVLLRTPHGHEEGTVSLLRTALFGAADLEDVASILKHADHLASAADRPQFPRDPDRRYPSWAQVVFPDEPELIHPLSGERVKVRETFSSIDPVKVEALSLDTLHRAHREVRR